MYMPHGVFVIMTHNHISVYVTYYVTAHVILAHVVYMYIYIYIVMNFKTLRSIYYMRECRQGINRC